MYDFTKHPIKKKTYSGANGNKISILIDDELYIRECLSHVETVVQLLYRHQQVYQINGLTMSSSIASWSANLEMARYLN